MLHQPFLLHAAAPGEGASEYHGRMNTETFLENPLRYFEGSYQQFVAFGGPCVYFHEQCLRAGADAFLSHRHIEMLYATLTAWGMHRMGEAKTKLVPWDQFSESVLAQKSVLEPLLERRMMDLSDAEYLQAIDHLKPAYCGLRVSMSDASIVANSKALFHILPELVPPIDRQYTWRFFHAAPDRWRDSKGKYRAVQLPAGVECQFTAFRDICVRIRQLADAAGRATVEAERQMHGVAPPKAVDNAIMNFVRLYRPAAEPTRLPAGIAVDAPDDGAG